MRTFQFQLSTPEEWYEVLHQQMPSTLSPHQFEFGQEMGSGTIQYTLLQEGIWVHQMNFKLKEPLKLYRQAKKQNDCFALNFYLSNSEIVYEGDDDSFKLGLGNVSVLLNSAAASLEVIFPPHRPIRIVNIGFTQEWLKTNLLIEQSGEKLAKLFLSNKPIYIYESLDYTAKHILSELNLNTLSRLGLFSRVLQLLDYMVHKLNKRKGANLVPANIHYEDFQQLMQSRNRLDINLTESIPVEELAQGASMSLSKFKRLFKQVFGTTPYRYYLENRMEQAMKMLTLGKKSVSEVGFSIGYSNLSQFSKAFKKQHGVLPSEV